MKVFFEVYPMVKDFELLLDFPKKGNIQIKGESWSFLKHGKGIKFFEISTNIIVDIHNNINNPKIVDIWRLIQYFSCNSEKEIEQVLKEMVLSGELKRNSEKQYELN
ncbi:hypothetical protein PXH59_18985 [Xenorhabdus sp. SF857]|nr:hypothetical protein [Xenorhabdus sp. SF857]WFQ79603.1 hypothetical protein PXH59_18985 [Xenorhabdus sp. SF857]